MANRSVALALLGVVMLALLACSLAFGQSPPPAQIASEQVRKQDDRVQEARNQRMPHEAQAAVKVIERGVVAPPVANQAVGRRQQAAEKENAQDHLNDGTKADWAMVGLTFGLLVVAAVQAGFFLWQLRIMRTTLRHTAAATAAAERSIRSAEESDRRGQRAYLCVERAWIEFPKPGCPLAQVEIKNSGQTPAHDVLHWINLQAHAYPLRAELPRPPEGFVMGSAVLAPGGTQILAADDPRPVCAPADLPLLGTAQRTIYVYGELTYRDAFDHLHHTRYRLMYGGSTPALPGLLRPCPEGNEAT